MKKLLFALLLLLGIAVATPVAEAGQYARIYTGRGVVYGHQSRLYAPYGYGRYRHRHHNHYRSYSYRPYYRNYYRRGYVSYPYYSNYGYSNYGYCRPHHGHYGRPHVSVAFSF